MHMLSSWLSITWYLPSDWILTGAHKYTYGLLILISVGKKVWGMHALRPSSEEGSGGGMLFSKVLEKFARLQTVEFFHRMKKFSPPVEVAK